MQAKNKQAKKRRVALLETETGWSFLVYANNLPYSIGRSPDNDLIFNSRDVSRAHCTLEFAHNRIQIRDTGSTNGTIIDNGIIQKESVPIDSRTCVLFATTLIWITPCDENGELITSAAAKPEPDHAHGICFADICKSTERPIQEVEKVLYSIRVQLLLKDAKDVLLLKPLGDGYLAVFNSPEAAVAAADRLLEWQRSEDNFNSADIRVTLDAGPTFVSLGQDRLGLAISRASRIEKTQLSDIESPGARIDKLRAKNRCLTTSYLRSYLNPAQRRRCLYIGRRRLQGFGETLFAIYQYSPSRKRAQESK